MTMKRIALPCGYRPAGLSAGAQVTLDECRRLAFTLAAATYRKQA